MLKNKILILATSLLLMGCSAKVVTYDQHGTVTGSCKATSFLTPMQGAASCYGYAHNDKLRFAKIKSNGQLELLALPPTAKVQLATH